MTILLEIHTWSKGLPAWQQDAIARIYASRELSVVAIEDLYALAKLEVGIADPAGRVPQTLDDAQVAPPADPTRLVQLVAIKDLSHVNALAGGGRLPIAPTGPPKRKPPTRQATRHTQPSPTSRRPLAGLYLAFLIRPRQPLLKPWRRLRMLKLSGLPY